MKKKYIGCVLGALLLVQSAPLSVSAIQQNNVAKTQDQIIQNSRDLLNKAKKSKSFYDYNIAYYSILDIKDNLENQKMLGELATIQNDVYTKDVLYYLDLLTKVYNKGSASTYNKCENELKASKLPVYDREYMLGELTSWGKEKVFTQDYKTALDSIMDCWNYVKKGSTVLKPYADKAQNIINKVQNEENRTYLLNELEGIRESAVNNQSGDSNNSSNSSSTIVRDEPTATRYENLFKNQDSMNFDDKKKALKELLLNNPKIKGFTKEYFDTEVGTEFVKIFRAYDSKYGSDSYKVMSYASNFKADAEKINLTDVGKEFTVTVSDKEDIDITDLLYKINKPLSQGMYIGVTYSGFSNDGILDSSKFFKSDFSTGKAYVKANCLNDIDELKYKVIVSIYGPNGGSSDYEPVIIHLKK
jgi:hypothetical protein